MEYQKEEENIPDNAYIPLTADIDTLLNSTNKTEEFIDANTVDFDKALSEELYDKRINIEIKTAKQLTGKQYLLIIPITRFFQNVRNMYALINILNGKSIISLRLIEYFVVNYVLENNTYYDINKYKQNKGFLVKHLVEGNQSNESVPSEIQPITDEEREQKKLELRNELREANFDNYFLIHDNYKSQLKEYNKKNFDPFCRWNRIRVYYEPKKYFYTTVAQLNFFKWAIENFVLDYILDNLEMIETSMNEYEKSIKLEKKVRKINLLNQIAQSQVEPIPTQSEDECLEDGQVKRTKKKELAQSNNTDRKSLKIRKKKEFTKTNRSIIKYNCLKVISFD